LKSWFFKCFEFTPLFPRLVCHLFPKTEYSKSLFQTSLSLIKPLNLGIALTHASVRASCSGAIWWIINCELLLKWGWLFFVRVPNFYRYLYFVSTYRKQHMCWEDVYDILHANSLSNNSRGEILNLGTVTLTFIPNLSSWNQCSEDWPCSCLWQYMCFSEVYWYPLKV
jgi:hypothetical protein